MQVIVSEEYLRLGTARKAGLVESKVQVMALEVVIAFNYNVHFSATLNLERAAAHHSISQRYEVHFLLICLLLHNQLLQTLFAGNVMNAHEGTL